MEDRSMTDPGPTGWAEDGAADPFGMERSCRAVFSGADPQFYERSDPKNVVDEEAMAGVVELARQNGIEDGMWLSLIEPQVFGFKLNWLRQIIGSCVGSSFMRGATLRMLWESFVLGEPEEIFGTKLVGTNNVAPFAPYGYRAGRKLANINRGDGSYCSVQIRGAKQYGILPCSAQGLQSDAFPEPQSSSLYRRWGNSDSLLNQFAPQARNFRLMESEEVTNVESAKVLIIDHFKPLEICSMWAFRPDYTHPTWELDGGEKVVVYKRDRSTSWAHAMMITAFVYVDGRWYVIVLNSWGKNAHKNGDWFAIPAELFDEWLRNADCQSIGNIDMADNVLPGDE